MPVRRKGESLFSTVTTGMVCGIHSSLVQVEVDTAQGLPCFQMVGFLGSEVKDITIAKMIQIGARKVAEICRFLPNIRGIPRFKVLISPHRAFL